MRIMAKRRQREDEGLCPEELMYSFLESKMEEGIYFSEKIEVLSGHGGILDSGP